MVGMALGFLVTWFLYFICVCIDGSPCANNHRLDDNKPKYDCVKAACGIGIGIYAFSIGVYMSYIYCSDRSRNNKEMTMLRMCMVQYVISSIVSLLLRQGYVEHFLLMVAYITPFSTFMFVTGGKENWPAFTYVLVVFGFILLIQVCFLYYYPDQKFYSAPDQPNINGGRNKIPPKLALIRSDLAKNRG